jgi:glycosyltransferase involved in cell wall biosynthesis
MNRLVCSSTDAIDERSLPARDRAAGEGGSAPARVLFLHGIEVGFATTTENLIHYAAGRADIDAVHVRLVMPGWLRLFCKQSPFPVAELDYRYLRHMIGWKLHLRTILGSGKRFDTDRFDVLHITTQQKSLIIPSFTRRPAAPSQPKCVINLDATLRNWESMRGLLRLAPPIDRALERQILRSANMLACATNWVARSAVDQYGVPESRVVIHKPCARTSNSVDPAPRVRASGQPLKILFVGGVWTDKGGPRLLRWHQERWAGRAELHIVSGSAPASALPARNVTFHGKVPHDRLVAEILPVMDIFVVPTKWDTFMIAAQEAQAAGLPVVTTRTGGVPECVRHGETGFLCERDDDAQYITAVECLLNAAAIQHARRDLSADIWHNHLLDQLVALADGRPIQSWPARVPRDPPTPAA